MNADVALLPGWIEPNALAGRTAVVFDVIRATSSITTALAHGASGVRCFASLDEARSARASMTGPALLAGEANCHRPDGFDLGNSPAAFSYDRCNGRVICLSTTNGTRALLASIHADRVFAGSLLNASATAAAVLGAGRDVLLVCASTGGRVALEDVVGAGAVIDAMRRRIDVRCSDSAKLAQQAFVSSLRDLPGVLRSTAGGQNVIAAGLADDLRFLARLDALPVVAELRDGLIIRNQTVV